VLICKKLANITQVSDVASGPLVCLCFVDFALKGSECGEGWVDDKESSCFYFINEPLTWQAAEDRCQEMGGHLISIDDATEQKFILGQSIRFLAYLS
jgi:hypothetical protein